MKEDIYCIACQCQTIINKQIKVSHNKIIDKMCGVIYTDYDINGDIKLLETNLLSLVENTKVKYPTISQLLQKHIEQYDNDKIIHLSAIEAIVDCIVSLEKKNVKSRIAAYDEYYKRMCPGYQRGEILMRREKLFNLGILSYKTNTPKSMRFNVLGLMNYMNTELLIGMSCDVANAFDALPKFTAMLQSIEVNE